MKRPDHSKLTASLTADYERHSPRSAAINRQALKRLVDGGSHTIRLLRPFPPRIASAQGAWLTADVTPELVFDTPAERMWDKALRSLGVEPGSLVPGFGVH